MKPLPIDPRVREYFSYDPETGDILWRKPATGAKGCTVRRVGDRAGCLVKMGDALYWQVRLLNRQYLGHRVAWFIQTGEQPPVQIDHVDCDGTNNAWANLRPATPLQNLANRRGFGAHKKGVQKAKSGRFTACIRVEGVKAHLGTFDTEDEAHAAYVRRLVELYGEFARAA